jgi:drug/metabolite transporter (DMT)-like permease
MVFTLAHDQVMLGMPSTGVAYILSYRLIADEGATSASTVTYVIPVAAVLLGAIVLGRAHHLDLFLGATISWSGWRCQRID